MALGRSFFHEAGSPLADIASKASTFEIEYGHLAIEESMEVRLFVSSIVEPIHINHDAKKL